MTIQEDILRILTQAKVEIQANMASKGINASGRTSKSFAVEQDEQSMQLVLNHDDFATIKCEPRPPQGLSSVQVGTAPLDTLEIGRPGGKVPRGFYYMIKQWTRDKGLQFATEQERQTFSYFTARKIAKQGTKRQTNPVDVWSTPAQKARDEIEKAVERQILVHIDKIKFNNI